jgi:hypothetical protein
MGGRNWNGSQCVPQLLLNKWNQTIEKSGAVSTINNTTGLTPVLTLLFGHIPVSTIRLMRLVEGCYLPLYGRYNKNQITLFVLTWTLGHFAQHFWEI